MDGKEQAHLLTGPPAPVWGHVGANLEGVAFVNDCATSWDPISSPAWSLGLGIPTRGMMTEQGLVVRVTGEMDTPFTMLSRPSAVVVLSWLLDGAWTEHRVGTIPRHTVGFAYRALPLCRLQDQGDKPSGRLRLA